MHATSCSVTNLIVAHETAIFPYSPSLHSLVSKTRRSEPDRLTMNVMGSFNGFWLARWLQAHGAEAYVAPRSEKACQHTFKSRRLFRSASGSNAKWPVESVGHAARKVTGRPPIAIEITQVTLLGRIGGNDVVLWSCSAGPRDGFDRPWRRTLNAGGACGRPALSGRPGLTIPSRSETPILTQVKISF
jgi:hypothetical protein